MSRNDIIIALFTIVYGLMLTDLFYSIHKLIRNKKLIKWHGLPMLAAWYLFLMILKNWWDLAFLQNIQIWNSIYFFIAFAHLLFLIFLSVSIVLPDNIQQNDVDLKDYYFKNHRYFWGLMSSIIFISGSINVVKNIYLGVSLNLSNSIASSIFFAFAIILAVSKRYWIHSTLMVIFVVETMLEIVNK